MIINQFSINNESTNCEFNKENECNICYEPEQCVELVPACKSAVPHLVCTNCIYKINKCPICRENLHEIYDIKLIMYTDIYNRNEVFEELYVFINEWHNGNLFNKYFRSFLTDHMLSVLTSAKKNQEYTLYSMRSIKSLTHINYQKNIELYYDSQYPTKWFTSYIKFNLKDNILIKTIVNPENICVDIDYVVDETNEGEIILLAGRYDISIIDTESHEFYKQLFVENNKHIFYNKDSYFCYNIDQLKNICRTFNIKNFSKLKKSDLIQLIIDNI